jgi:hypothetical protein
MKVFNAKKQGNKGAKFLTKDFLRISVSLCLFIKKYD